MPVGALNEGIQKLARDSVDALVPLIMQRVYADGAWLPTLTTAGGSVTHTTRRGTFTRVGGQVWFHAQITLSAISSPTGDVTITGLPLVSAQRGGAWLVNMAGVTLSAGYSMLSGEIAAGTSTIKLRQQGSAVAALTLPGTALSATTTIEIAGMYYASDIATLSLEDTILSFGPIAYWPGNEPTGTVMTDVSGNARHGTYDASVTVGQSYSPFTCPSYNDGVFGGHATGYSAGLAGAIPAGGMTMLAFGRVEAYDSKTAIAINVNGANFAQITMLSSGRPRLRYNAGGTLVNVDSPNILALGAWVQLAATITAPGTARLYVNGVEGGAGTLAVAYTGTPTAILVGANSTASGTAWQNQLAHVALFPTVLSAANIAAIYAASGL